uniref:Uncharacterized protein n=1 Tax=Ditylenchus dipsaci TaxID=166011 RepID=A0A915DIK6_9BILA
MQAIGGYGRYRSAERVELTGSVRGRDPRVTQYAHRQEMDAAARHENITGESSFYCYLLLDSSFHGSIIDFASFVSSVFYIEKGQGTGVHRHLRAARVFTGRIHRIWSVGAGVKIVQPFINIGEREAFDREASMIDTTDYGLVVDISFLIRYPLIFVLQTQLLGSLTMESIVLCLYFSENTDFGQRESLMVWLLARMRMDQQFYYAANNIDLLTDYTAFGAKNILKAYEVLQVVGSRIIRRQDE